MANAKDGAAPIEGTRVTDMEERDAAKRTEEAEEGRRRKQVFRETNLKPERPDDSFFRSLDSSVKRNTAAIKKLRAVSEETRPSLLEELKSVNLSKYLSEAVAAIVEAKLKTADIDAAVQVSSLLHIRYKHFTPQLLEALLKIFAPSPKGAPEAEEKGARLSKRRTALRLLTELLIAGVVTDSAALVGVIKELAKPDQAKDRDAAQAAGTLLVAFLKQAKEPLRLSSNTAKDTPGPFSPPVLTEAECASILGHLGTFYTAAEALLLSEHKSLRALEAENAAVMTSKGELSEETTAAYEKQRKAYEQLLRTLSS